MDHNISGSLSTMPGSRIIDFDKAEIRTVAFQDSLYLWVSGTLPGPNLEVRLAPRHYTDRPDYWAIEVAAMRPSGTGANPIDTHDPQMFECAIPLIGVLGVRGITVVGANRVQRIKLTANQLVTEP